MWACDRNFEVVLWNSGAEEIYGYTAEEMIGGNYLDKFIDEAERDASLADCARIIDGGKRYRNLLAYDTNASGDVRYMLTNCFRIIDPETGERYQAEVGVEISDLELRKDEHRSLRELGIARREARRHALQRDRDDAILRVGRLIDEVRYMRDRTLRELDDFLRSASIRNKARVSAIHRAQVARVTDTAAAVLRELQAIETRCRAADTAEALASALNDLGDNPRVWTDRLRPTGSEWR